MAITSRQQADMGEPGTIHITYGYSRDHRPDLKQFMVDLMCSKDGDIPFYKMA
jgi:transposase